MTFAHCKMGSFSAKGRFIASLHRIARSSCPSAKNLVPLP